LVAAATRNGRTLIAVILGAPDAGYQEAASLLDAGFAMAPGAAGTGGSVPAVAVSRCSTVPPTRPHSRSRNTASDHADGGHCAAVVPVLDSPPLAAASTHARTASVSTTHHSAGLLRPRNIVPV